MTTGSLLHRNTRGTLTLTQGALNIDFENRQPGNFPRGTMSRLAIKDSSGIELAEWDGEIRGRLINYTVDYDDHASVPLAAQYALFVTWPDGIEYQWEYGYVIREQMSFPNAPAAQLENRPLSFTYVPGSGVGSQWRKTGGVGNLKVWDNSVFSLPKALGVDNSWFTKAAAVWETPFATDSVKTVVKTINGGAGLSSVVQCSDINMTSYLAVGFETGVANNRLHIFAGDGPVSMDDLLPPVANTVAHGDTYSIVYDDASKIIAVYKGSSLDPVIEWEDDGNVIPHGQGYTYGGVNFQASLLAPGTEYSYWAMKDN